MMVRRADASKVREIVRSTYAKVAKVGRLSCCGGGDCCSDPEASDASTRLGYSARDRRGVPKGADMGLGCGNPQAIAALKAGEVVVDLGSGGGLDCFLAAQRVGRSGRVIGVDMTPEMVERARKNARKARHTNVEFRLGEIEHLPVADGTADVIISNCVVNLSPDKGAVLREAFRVLRPGGRLAIMDVVALRPLPKDLRGDMVAYAGCVAGAITVRRLERTLRDTGFEHVKIKINARSREIVRTWFPDRGLEAFIASGSIEAVKPRTSS